VTARKKDEEKKEEGMLDPESIEALRASNELFSLFMRHSPVYAYIKSVTPTESRLLQASDNYQKMLGSSSLDIVGKTMAELFPAEFAAKMTADDWAVVANGNVLQMEKDLDDRSYISIKFPFVQGDKNMLAGYMFDITERKQAEESLKKSEQLLKEAQEAAQINAVAERKQAEGKLREVEEKLREGEEKLRVGEGKLRAGEEKLQAVEEKLRAGEGKLRAGEEKLRAREKKLQEVEGKLRAGEKKLQEVEGKLRVGEEKLQEVEGKLRVGEEKLRKAEDKLRTDRENLRREEEKLRAGEDKLRAGEEKLRRGEEALRKDREKPRAAGAPTASLEEKELLREIHNHVKNNMSSIIALMEMQRKMPRKLLGKPALTDSALSALESRIRSMALIHERLYQSQTPSRIDFQDYLSALVAHLRTSLDAPPDLVCSVDAAGIALKLDTAVPVGIIVNELVTNAFKYAFPKNQPQFGADKCEIKVSLERRNAEYTLTVEDNGVGLPKQSSLVKTSTLGLRLVRMLGVNQLDGKFKVNRIQGTRFVLKFNVKE
jgi:PAS domain S-box-containing protein